ncbi:MAG: cupin domain-containing protein [Pseudopedobacter saltans]|uniref:Cupin domain-containing protein n=1 Tax=Pseudopedobacter saltans TaxID=151895 RepID=A0A2W5HA09_9SPHI|nr:MAG: cupin domain-containing protein [Pseudopedobacter saltans]
MKYGIINQTDLNWEDLSGGISRQIYSYNDQIMMVKVKFDKGAVGAPHSHPHIQSTYVDSGKFEVTIDGETSVIGEGDGFMVLPDLIHGCVCLEAGCLIDVFIPMREDFL